MPQTVRAERSYTADVVRMGKTTQQMLKRTTPKEVTILSAGTRLDRRTRMRMINTRNELRDRSKNKTSQHYIAHHYIVRGILEDFLTDSEVIKRGKNVGVTGSNILDGSRVSLIARFTFEPTNPYYQHGGSLSTKGATRTIGVALRVPRTAGERPGAPPQYAVLYITPPLDAEVARLGKQPGFRVRFNEYCYAVAARVLDKLPGLAKASETRRDAITRVAGIIRGEIMRQGRSALSAKAKEKWNNINWPQFKIRRIQ